MKIKKIVSTIFMAATVTASSMTAFAKDVTVTTDIPQPDEICGYLNIIPTTQSDVYVKIYKLTPETEKEDYIVYDTVIEADAVHNADKYTFGLEYNNLNNSTGKYESSYEIMIGVNKYSNSSDENDIVYNTFNLEVEDTNYTGNETNCLVNIKITDEELEQPLCEKSGDRLNIVYDMTFSNTQKITVEILRGDANLDSKVNVRDCAAIATALAQGKADTLTEEADYNSDGKINVRDAAAIAAFLAANSK